MTGTGEYGTGEFGTPLLSTSQPAGSQQVLLLILLFWDLNFKKIIKKLQLQSFPNPFRVQAEPEDTLQRSDPEPAKGLGFRILGWA